MFPDKSKHWYSTDWRHICYFIQCIIVKASLSIQKYILYRWLELLQLDALYGQFYDESLYDMINIAM